MVRHILLLLLCSSLSIGCGQDNPVDNGFDEDPTLQDGDSADPIKSVSPEDSIRAAIIDGLNRKVDSWIENGQVVGTEYMVFVGDELWVHEAKGWRDKENAVPMDLNTIFDIQSMTKPVVATGIFRLATQGLLDLDDPISKFIPTFAPHSTTIRQALTRTDGFTSSPISRQNYSTLTEAVDDLARIGPNTAPGSVFSRDPTDTMTLGAVIEHITGLSLDEYLGEEILSALGMNGQSYLHLNSGSAWRAEMSSVYQRFGGQTGDFVKVWSTDMPSIFTYFPAAAGIYSTTTEYAKFLQFWMDRGNIDGVQFIDEKYVDEALIQEPLSTALSTSYGTTPYGLHWDLGPGVLRPGTGIASYGHPGGFGTIGWIIPEKEIRVLYFTQSWGGQTHFQFVEEVIRLMGNS